MNIQVRNIFQKEAFTYTFFFRDDGELESLIVVRDKGDKKKQKAQCTTELDHEDDGDYV